MCFVSRLLNDGLPFIAGVKDSRKEHLGSGGPPGGWLPTPGAVAGAGIGA